MANRAIHRGVTAERRTRLHASGGRLLDRLEAHARRLALTRKTDLAIIGAVPIFAALCIGVGVLLFGRSGAHQLFRDLGPASFATSVMMLCCATLGALIARREAREGDWRDLNNFWFLAAIGFLYLSVEAPMDIHGKVGGALDDAFGPPPVISHGSDGILFLYMAAGLAVAAFHWRELNRSRPALALLAAGALVSAGMLAIDSGTAQRPWQQVAEETLELFAAALLVLAFLERFRFSLRWRP